MSRDLYVIEARKPDGALDLSGPQPNDIFGEGAMYGMDDWQMSRAILRVKPEVFGQLHGGNIVEWPSFIDPRWRARIKRW